MKSTKTGLTRLLSAGLLVAAAAVCGAQTPTTIAAEFDTPPAAGSEFTINLVNRGEAKDVAGFAFKLLYDPSQVSIAGVTDNTGQSAASVQYTLGAETLTDDSGTSAQRILSATTLEDLKNASKLVQIRLQKKPGFAPPLRFEVLDRATTPVIDGLQGATLENIPHMFDSSAVNQ